MLVLVVNAGSSSLKYQLIDMSNETVLAKGIAERIGEKGSNGSALTHQAVVMAEPKVIQTEIPDHNVAMRLVFDALTNPDTGVVKDVSQIGAVGHRVVHGGESFSDSVIIDDDVIDTVARLSLLAPLHNPPNLMGVEAAMRLLPKVPHVAVFDTAFHHSIPRHAYIYALPYELYQQRGVRRYGFHGTSHKYVSSRAIELLASQGVDRDSSRIITCHLGNGVSMTAVQGGKSVDTSMGLTPLEGLVMGTRSGDVDPGILIFMLKELAYTVDDVDNVLNKKSGLLGISGIGNDMRDIESEASAGHKRSQLALDVFCYRVRKYIGAYAAAMGGLDALVFTAGIGENSPGVRAQCCEGLGFLGVEVDPEKNKNAKGECDISKTGTPVRVYIIPTNEELAIARETVRVVTRAEG